jgi:hypothetical protein
VALVQYRKGVGFGSAPFLCVDWDLLRHHAKGGRAMNLNVEVLNPLVALIAGILILIMPRLLNYVVAIYLIVIGILGLSHHYHFHI